MEEYDDLPRDWALVYEAHIADMVAERELAQLDLADSVKAGDLAGATIASFRHAVASAELRDPHEAQVHLIMAAVFAEADVRLIANQVDDELLDLELDMPAVAVTFDIPWAAGHQPIKHVESTAIMHRWRYDSRLSDEEQAEACAIQSKVIPSIELAEVVANIASVEPYEKNQALLDALQATSQLIFVKSVPDNERNNLLRTACQMASVLEVQGSYECTRAALEAYQHLALSAIATQGKTMPALTQALRGLQAIVDGPYKHVLTEEAQPYIDELTKARQFKVAYNSLLLPAIRMWDAYRPYLEGSNDFRITPSRVSRGMQSRARSAHEAINLQATEQPTQQLVS